MRPGNDSINYYELSWSDTIDDNFNKALFGLQ